MSDDRYELYRVITDYEALQDGFLDRIDELNTTQGALPGFADGAVQKLLTKSTGSPRQEVCQRESGKKVTRFAPRQRAFGWESLGKMLAGTGLALVLVVDDVRFAETKAELAKRKRQPTNVSSKRPSWLFTKRNAANMRALGIKSLSPQQRKRIAKKAGKASGRARRRKARAVGALLTSGQLAPSHHGQSSPTA